MLRLNNVYISYGLAEIIHGVTLHVDENESVALVGSNGAGKSTILKAISSLIHPNNGTIIFLGKHIHHLPAFSVARLGIAHVPEGRRMFPQLSVDESLDIGSYSLENKKERKKTKEWIYSIFQILKERRRQLAGTLSGGEQQMLAVARGLMMKPRFIMLDEPSLGLAPVIVDTIYKQLNQIRKEGKASILLVEQDVLRALQFCDRGYVLENGRICLKGRGAELLRNQEVKTSYLGI
ncbi:MAG: ABC transporter ATP-binding protein [Candidatus Atribacteria bacterium]